jgi:hypothetical protein
MSPVLLRSEILYLQGIRITGDQIRTEQHTGAHQYTAMSTRLLRRRHVEEAWEEAGMSVDAQSLLSGQERGVTLVYHVIAVNKAGEGEPSNIVTTVL